MKTKILLALLALCLGSVFVGCGKSEKSQAKVAKYFCPMHPTYTSDRPGDCPICNMKLVPIKETGSAPAMTAHTSAVPGRIMISISPEKRQLIGLATSTVERRNLSHALRTTGIVTHDETRLASIAPRFGGWVRKLHVNYVGAPVEKGQPLFSAYSPDLFSAENEYVLALRNFNQLTNNIALPRESAKRLLDGATRRLELLQVGEEEIRALDQRGTPADEMVFRAPFSGHVTAKEAVEGKAFMSGDTLYEIADLSHLWVRASVFEFELPQIKVSQKARVTFPNLGGKTFESAVTFISPHIEPQTRRGEVRLEVDNPDLLLKPDMWADVQIEIPLGEALTVPASAVIDTGTRHVVFVDRDDGHLEPREVKVGARTSDYWQISDGLKEGERVVTRSLFLVDSESQLKAAISGMGAAGEHKH